MLLKPVTSIVVPKDRLRELDEETVALIMSSAKNIGIFQPILINGNTLVAGNHRLEACRRLGIQSIPCLPVGNMNDKDLNTLIEIEENLIRLPLTPAEKNHHMDLRTNILAKRMQPEKRKEAADKHEQTTRIAQKSADEAITESRNLDKDYPNCVNTSESRDLDKDYPNSGVKLSAVQQDIITAGDAAARAEVIEDTAKMLKTNATNVRAAIADAQAVDNVDLPMEDLKKLNGVQYKQVAKVAKTKDKEAAHKELKEQLKDKKHSNGQPVSVVMHDTEAYLGQQIKYVKDQATRLKSPGLFKHIKLSTIENLYFVDCIDSLASVAKVLKAKQKEAKEKLVTESANS